MLLQNVPVLMPGSRIAVWIHSVRRYLHSLDPPVGFSCHSWLLCQENGVSVHGGKGTQGGSGSGNLHVAATNGKPPVAASSVPSEPAKTPRRFSSCLSFVLLLCAAFLSQPPSLFFTRSTKTQSAMTPSTKVPAAKPTSASIYKDLFDRDEDNEGPKH